MQSESTKDYKYEVKVIKLDKSLRIPKEITSQLSGILSRKKISQLKKEAVECPVLGKQVPFLQCFVCKNFVRRVRGIVYCRGEALN